MLLSMGPAVSQIIKQLLKDLQNYNDHGYTECMRKTNDFIVQKT